MKLKLALLVSYFAIMPVFLLTLIAYSIILMQPQYRVLGAQTDLLENVAYQSISVKEAASNNLLETKIATISKFLNRYESPLLPYSSKIVETADKYGIDYRLLTAIAMQESTLCRKIPKESYNCWGFGIYGNKVTRFSSYDEAIETISKTLAVKYKEEKGLEEPHEIMTRYTPGSNGSWAEKVSYVMTRIGSSM